MSWWSSHSKINLTMDVYGELAGKMALGDEQAARFDRMASETALTLVNTWSTGDSKTPQSIVGQPKERKAISA
jgi:hypothetical protein